MLKILSTVNFTTYFFFRDKLPINMKILVFFLAKCVQTVAKTMVVDRKNQKALALPYLASKLLRNAAMKRFANHVCSRTDNKDEVLRQI